MLKRNKTIEDSNLLKEIQRNNTKEHEVEQELMKEDGLAWEQNEHGWTDIHPKQQEAQEMDFTGEL